MDNMVSTPIDKTVRCMVRVITTMNELHNEWTFYYFSFHALQDTMSRISIVKCADGVYSLPSIVLTLSLLSSS